MLASSRYWAAHDRKAETASRQEGATAEKAVPFSKPRLSIVIPPYELRLYAPLTSLHLDLGSREKPRLGRMVRVSGIGGEEIGIRRL